MESIYSEVWAIWGMRSPFKLAGRPTIEQAKADALAEKADFRMPCIAAVFAAKVEGVFIPALFSPDTIEECRGLCLWVEE